MFLLSVSSSQVAIFLVSVSSSQVAMFLVSVSSSQVAIFLVSVSSSQVAMFLVFPITFFLFVLLSPTYCRSESLLNTCSIQIFCVSLIYYYPVTLLFPTLSSSVLKSVHFTFIILLQGHISKVFSLIISCFCIEKVSGPFNTSLHIRFFINCYFRLIFSFPLRLID